MTTDQSPTWTVTTCSVLNRTDVLQHEDEVGGRGIFMYVYSQRTKENTELGQGPPPGHKLPGPGQHIASALSRTLTTLCQACSHHSNHCHL